ncbi:MAG TPA: tetratricopeptide repeat protein [Phycisphaerae bacterium]|nr:tetratricopeptide repeat protein [Phycisphaerae bacterium]
MKLAFVRHQAGKLAEAETLYSQVLAHNPRHADAWHLSGVIAYQTGRHQLATELIGRAIAIKPSEAIYHNNLGLALQSAGALDAAVCTYQQAIKLQPDYAEAFNNLGLVRQAQGRIDLALEAYRQSLKINTNVAGVYNNLGCALEIQEQLDSAISAYQQAIKLDPKLVQAYNNIGGLFYKHDQFEKALQAYQTCLQLQPDFVEARNNLAGTLRDLGRFDAAITEYRKTLQIKPGLAQVHSNLIYTLYYHPRFTPEMILQECLLWNRIYAEPLKSQIRPHPNLPDPDRRLKIGYVSADFKHHASAFFLKPLLSRHHHEHFEIFCYANVAKPDATTRQLQTLADHWRNILGMSDENLAEQIRRDQIDILVDLKLHTADNRLLTFARKPAPVQATWLGYPGTTGLTAIDYRFTDPYLDPPGVNGQYTEESIRLPDSFWCYDSLSEEPAVNELPALKNGYVTFGCLNQFRKINDGVLELWSKVLKAVPGSRLLFFVPEGQVRRDVAEKFKRSCITAESLEFLERLPRQEYLKLYHRIDLGLDPFPCNGHTTGFDSLWMGVPFVTLAGSGAMGRAGLSQLTNLGLKEFIARSPEEYVTQATAAVGDLAGLAKLRGTLRQRMQASPLMDAERFTRNMEAAYRDMWRKWCAKA